jgi:hypothetical protein
MQHEFHCLLMISAPMHEVTLQKMGTKAQTGRACLSSPINKHGLCQALESEAAAHEFQAAAST